MAEQQSGEVSVTLKIDPKVHEAFLRKAQQANMDLEEFLSSTLAIVLGCRVFNEKYSCSPALFAKKAPAEA
ncbi:MAG TPA: hypothetical protein VFF03_19210 [Rhodocyclaceae bacterium]|nr:hypothetical protein [Rhodocyclaceae bacterium]